MYDYLIVGAGISGLYTALKLYQSYPNKSICIIETSAYIGGRIHSIKYDSIIVDGGAARFNTEQYRIISLINELDLIKKVIPISNQINYKSINPKYDINLETIFPNIHSFIFYLQNYIKKHKITDKELINTTILELVENTKTSKYKPISDKYPTIKQYLIDIYPYYSELGVLNALESIYLFTHEYSDKMKYMILNGGMEQIIDKIIDKLKKISTIKIYKEYTLENIVKIYSIDGTYHYEVICNKNIKLNTCHLILTIPKNKLLQIDYLTKHKTLLHNINSVQNEPLYRIYARYPLNKQTGKVWFDGMIKISTNNPIKYIIPINSKKGVILISYTDSKFAKFWLKYVNNGTFETILNKYLKELFPHIDIPKAKWYKHCYWAVGAGYWKSKYDRTEIIHKMIQPIPNEKIYICGENYSSYQAWIEGSLETSNLVLSKLGIDITYNNKNINKNNITKVKEIIKITKNKNILNSNNKIKNLKKMLTKKKNISRTNITKSNKYNKGNKNNKSNKDNKGKKVLSEYTLEEVSKHNKKSDAWIVINNKVLDITEWIPKHPGGDIIMKGVGKDATTLFNNIGHDDYAKKMLKKYKIGILKK